MKQPVKVAIFARVSKSDGRQNTDRQINDLNDLAKNRGWQVVETITEQISGATKTAKRPEVQKLFALAEAKVFEKVIVTEISRLGRNVSESLNLLERLTKAGISTYVQNISAETLSPDGTENPSTKMIMTTLSAFAEMERGLLRERIISGLETARKKGVKLGRREGSTESDETILARYPKAARAIRDGLSVRRAAKVGDVSNSTIQKLKRILEAKRAAH